MDSLSADQRIVLLEILAAQHPEMSQYFWLSLAEFYERNPYESPPNVLTIALQILEQSPYVTFRVDEKQFFGGGEPTLYVVLTRNHDVHVGTKVITLGPGKAIDPTEVVTYDPKHTFTSLQIPPVKIDNKAAAKTIDALRPIFDALADIWHHHYSPADAATIMESMATSKSQEHPSVIRMPTKRHTVAHTVALSKTQLAFIRRLISPVSFKIVGRSEKIGTRKKQSGIARDQYVAFLNDLLTEEYDVVSGSVAFDALVSDNQTLMEAALANRDLEHAKFMIGRALTRDRNVQLMTLGLFRRFAAELSLTHDHNSSTPFAFLASMNERDRLILTQRVGAYEQIMNAMKFNNCPHTRVRRTPGGGVSKMVRDEFIGEVSDDVVLCKKCHLPFMCRHVTGDLAPATYMRRVGKQTLCKLCGEVLQERLLDDIDEERVVDEEFQRQLWGCLQNIKEQLLLGVENERNDRKILSFVARPLYDQYMAIEKMRTMRFELREILQRFYMDVYMLVTLGMMRYRLRDINGLDSIVKYLLSKNQANIASMQMDEIRVKAIISSAAKSLSDRLNNTAGAVEINPAVIDINHSIIFQQLLAGNLASTSFFLDDLTDPKFVALIGKRFDDFRRDPDWSFVRNHISEFPIVLRPYILWLLQKEPLENPPEIVAASKSRLKAEANRLGWRRTGATYLPKLTWQFWFPGPVDFTVEPTKTYVYRNSAGKIVDIDRADIKKRPGGMQFVDYRRADGKLLREDWWNLGYIGAYTKTAESGRGFIVQHVSAESLEAAKQIRRKMTHNLFVEAYERICPAAKDLQLHDMHVHNADKHDVPRCSICHATYDEITKSLDYFEQFEVVFGTIYTREIHLEGVGGGHTFTYKDPHKIVAGSSDMLDNAVGQVQLIVPAEPEYWKQLGNLVGRTYEETLQMTRDGVCPANIGRHRYGVIVGHIRNVYRMLGYVVNLDKYGSSYKHPQLYDMARKKPANADMKKYHEDLGVTVDNLGGEPLYDESQGQKYIDGAIAILCTAIARIHKMNAEFGVFLASSILASDKNTAVLTTLDFINKPTSISDDHQNDADLQAMELRSRHEDDPLFQDFDFEGGDDNIAMRD